MNSVKLTSLQNSPSQENSSSSNTRVLDLSRWVTYQNERFPIVQYAPLVAAFAASGLALSYMTLQGALFPSLKMFATAFVVAFLTFVQLRVSDEFKDKHFDLKHHPDRPVPRGLVSLDELKWIGVGSAIVQSLFALSLSPMLMLPLAATWAYLFCMHNEFFIGEWLNKHPLLYMLSHMGILFFTDFFITACHWMVLGLEPSNTLLFFFGTSFKLGMVIEIGRKIKAPVDEIPGANTYSRTWGLKNATIAWIFTLLSSGTFAIITAAHVGFGLQAGLIIATLFTFCLITAFQFLNQKSSKLSKRIESLSGMWTLSLYLQMGVVPLIYNSFTPFIQQLVCH